MAALREPYVSYPLAGKNGERLIRVLKILTKANERRLRCSLKVIDLNKAPVYDCLSYTWSEPLYHELSAGYPLDIRTTTGDLDHEIECDGKMIPITENLEDALLQFSETGFVSNSVEGRQENREGLIWIDAICINQKDEAEKDVQIAMMDEVYTKARRVIAWLGRCDEHVHPALEIIKRIKSIPPEQRQVTITDFECPEYRSLFGNPPISSQQWNDYAAFIQRAWFNRVWIIQEAFLANHIDVLCGPHVLSWKDDLWDVAKFLRDSKLGTSLAVQVDGTAHPDRKSTTYINNSLNNQYQLEAMKEDAAKKPLSLERLLVYGRYFQAGQAQDYVYGLLGIWKSSNKTKKLPPDMSIDQSLKKESDFVARVFTKYSWVSIRNTKDLNILSLVDDPSTRAQQHLHSWVPDYSVGFHVHPLAGVPRPDPEKQRWNASKGLPPFEVPTSNSEKLSVRGILFDVINDTATTYSGVIDQHDINSLLLLLRYPGEKYPTGCTPVEALWRTLIKDTFCEKPAGDQARDTFQYLIAGHVGDLEDASQGFDENANTEEMSTLLEKTESTIGQLGNKYKNDTAIPDMEAIHGIIQKVGSLNPASDEKKKLDRDFDDITESFRVAYSCRRLFRTKQNYLGIAAESLEKGDAVWVLSGAAVPLVLRLAKDGGWKLVGEAYVHGVMNGEVVKLVGKELQKIDLV
ncbi:related to heterokaryon incompatibility protein (het-6OR allele) [Phialocephala subalpina]|uniref:Related to heterokaryon incompatibility protein (Het-6OR allele) n=1 Tax=Phialocephala subalpina TaxID=576137 RepID=A0A1L7XNM6_9HELO|nr:related to heterokaryon incompatibility protein (het-6OR allele) [Phialocephala subalpina]